MNLSVVILTFNSERTIGETIRAAALVSDDIHVVDSFSSDATCAAARQLGAHLVQHEFLTYAAQRNWAIENLPLKHDWELHLDADEHLSDTLVAELNRLRPEEMPGGLAGYHVARLVRFLGRPIRHGGMFPIWHLRLFRRGAGRCEDREYDQHFIVSGPTGKLRGWIVDDIRMPLSEWIVRHNRWSDAEVRNLLNRAPGSLQVRPDLFGSPVQRKRYLRKVYGRFPLFSRAFLLFFYRYILRGGFLDGKEGAVFFVLQTLWFRFLVDAKLFEQTLGSAATTADTACIAETPRSLISGGPAGDR
jgi:glycosyltransferase involved in cell wall biosynthesis